MVGLQHLAGSKQGKDSTNRRADVLSKGSFAVHINNAELVQRSKAASIRHAWYTASCQHKRGVLHFVCRLQTQINQITFVLVLFVCGFLDANKVLVVFVGWWTLTQILSKLCLHQEL